MDDYQSLTEEPPIRIRHGNRSGMWNLARVARLLLLLGFFLIGVGVLITALVMPDNSAAVVTESPSSQRPRWLSNFLKTMDLKPGVMFVCGITCFSTGLFFEFERWSRRKLRHSWDERTDSSAQTKRARDTLQALRFQQSYSSGWGGAIKLPIGFEESVKHEMSIAERQRSLPEIVEWYRGFVSQITNEYELVIGIDELDKLADDEDAQHFLNERLFAPLGMTDTGFLPDRSLLPRIAPTERCAELDAWPCKRPDAPPLRGVVHDPTSRRMGGVAKPLIRVKKTTMALAKMLAGGEDQLKQKLRQVESELGAARDERVVVFGQEC
jgi:hypothetical protein